MKIKMKQLRGVARQVGGLLIVAGFVGFFVQGIPAAHAATVLALGGFFTVLGVLEWKD